jgi:hypothetical protein
MGGRTHERLACFCIVPRDNGSARRIEPATVAEDAGSPNEKTIPRGEFGAAEIRPPWDSMIDRLIARPIPIPCGLVEKKGSKIRCTAVGGNQSEAARRLGLSRGALIDRLRKYRLVWGAASAE